MDFNKLLKHNRMRKRILSVFMIFCMGLSLLPQGTVSFAAKTEDVMPIAETHNGIPWSDDDLPTDEGNYYLSNDITINASTTAGKYDWKPKGNITLCLNGHKITCNAFINMMSGNVTIDDCGDEGCMVFNKPGNSPGYSAIRVGYNEAVHLTINRGKFERNDDSRSTIGVYSGSTLTINGGSFTHSKGYAFELNIFDTTLELSGSPEIVGDGASGDILDATGYGDEQGQIKVTDKLTKQYSLCIADLKYQLGYLQEYPFTSSQDTSLNKLENFQVYDVDTINNGMFTPKAIEELGYVARKNLNSGQLEVIDPNSMVKVNFDYQEPDKGDVGSGSIKGNSIESYYYNKDGTYYGLPTPEKTGYTFEGWYTAQTNGDKVSNGGKVKSSDEHTLYAHWTVNSYDIEYQDEGGNAFSGENEGDLPHGHKYNEETVLVDASKTGYKFLGWYTTSTCDDNSSVTKLEKYSHTAKITLYAKWEAVTYNITYQDEGDEAFSGENEEDLPHNYIYNEDTELEDAFKLGYEFKGWYTTSACDGTPVTKLEKESYTADITLYAKWEVKTYKITYKDEGGNAFSGENEDALPHGYIYNIGIDRIPDGSREGYKFLGWYTTSACDGTPVEKLEPNLYTADITLYAKWEVKTYKITYKDEGDKDFSGENEDALPHDYKYNEDTALIDASKLGYNFLGWYTTSACDGTPVTELEKESYTADITLYAKWEVKTYKITYKDEGGNAFSGENEDALPHEYIYNIGIDQIPDGSREGYKFLGWYTTSACDGAPVEKLEPNLYTADITLYAKWKVHEWVVTYDYAGADEDSKGDASKTVTYGSTYGELPTPTKTGYIFKGWYTESDGKGDLVDKDTEVTTDKNHTLYAKWEVKTYNIIYRDAGSEDYFSGENIAVLPRTHKYNEETTLIPASKPGYDFEGWYTTIGCDEGTSVTSLGPNKLYTTANIVLYAKWKVHTWEVTYDYDGADGGNEEKGKTVTYGSTYEELPTPTKTGYIFKGWYTESDGKGDLVDKDTEVTTDKDHTIHAYWKNTFDIIYRDAGDEKFSGDNKDLPETYKYDEGIDLIPASKRGYKFLGWYTTIDCDDGTSVTSLEKGLYTADITLYAKWEVETYEIEYIDAGNKDFSGENEDKLLHEHIYNENTKLKDASKPGYKFLGWYEDIDCEGQKVTELKEKSYTAKITLYAKWEAETYKIEYRDKEDNAFSGENEDKLPHEHIYNENTKLKDASKPGYKFLGWYEDIDCEGQKVTELKEETYTADITLYAKWEALTCRVTYDYDGADGGNEEVDKTVTYDSTYGDLPTPTKTGYDFKGWYKKQDGSGEKVESTTKVETFENHTLYAKFEKLNPTPSASPKPTPSASPKPTPGTPSKPTPGTPSGPTPSTSPEPTPSTSPEPTPGTPPEPTPSTSPEPTPSTPPEPTPSTSPEPTPSTSPELTPSTSPEPTPSTSSEPTPGAPMRPMPSVPPSATPGITPPTATISPSVQEKNSIAMMAGFKISQTDRKISIKWGKVGGADGYKVYVRYCGKKFASKPAKTLRGASVTKTTVTKIDSKKLNLKKNYKIYIAAYKTVKGKKAVIGKTLIGHVVGRNNKAYTNVKRVKLVKSKVTIKAGKSVRIKAKTVLVDKSKKQLTDAHAKELRYKSTDTSVASVSKKGKITAKGKGTCIVYVYARNGYAKKVNVTVK